MQLINLTPHSISLYSPAGVENIPPSGQLARVKSTSTPLREINTLPVVRTTFTTPEGLPAPQHGVGYIVSMMIITALQAMGIERTDVFAPATGPNDGAVRNAQGHVVGVTRLIGM
jgi:hypothetical protein